MLIETIFQTLTKQLYPTGRAFKHPTGGTMDKVNKALSIREAQVFKDAKSILDSILPDNANFTIEDATQWEVRLGLIVNQSVSLTDRKAAIIRKMNHPGDISARQHYLYLERSLQLANFNVYVQENLAGQSPQSYINALNYDLAEFGSFEYDEYEYGYDAAPVIVVPFQYGQFQYGQLNYGGGYNNIVANYIDSDLDAAFDVGGSFRSAFFIGGPTFGSFANVDANREQEFRQLILKLKPANTIAFIFINYI